MPAPISYLLNKNSRKSLRLWSTASNPTSDEVVSMKFLLNIMPKGSFSNRTVTRQTAIHTAAAISQKTRNIAALLIVESEKYSLIAE